MTPTSTENLRQMLDLLNENDASRWEVGFRNIVAILHGSRHTFEIKDVVEEVKALARTQSPAEPVPFPPLPAAPVKHHALGDLFDGFALHQYALRYADLVLAAQGEQPQPEKIAPVQGYTPGIPWSLHLEAYDAYKKRWGAQQALIDLEGRNCRGGFGTSELDGFIPGWRDRVSEIGKLRAEVARLNALLEGK